MKDFFGEERPPSTSGKMAVISDEDGDTEVPIPYEDGLTWGDIRLLLERQYPGSAVYCPIDEIPMRDAKKVRVVRCWAMDDPEGSTREEWAVTLGVPENWGSLRLECIKELGYARMYMDYLHPDSSWAEGHTWEPQRSRVNELCDELARESRNLDMSYWVGLRDRILNDIENMC